MNPKQKTTPLAIDPADLLPMEALMDNGFLRIHLAYAHENNLLFGERIYRPEASLYLHRRLAKVVEYAAHAARNGGFRIVLYDGLRTTTAQARMLETQRVKENPHWLEEPRLLSPPGKGAHPRAMAVDVSLETLDGDLLDMGTPFDFLASDPSPVYNPAHRGYAELSESAAQNRALLDKFMTLGAQEAAEELVLLPQEWWDFRLPVEVYETYAALSDDDLPANMKML